MPKTTKDYDDMIEVLDTNRRSVVSNAVPTDSDTELILQMLQIHGQADFTERQCRIIRNLNFESITRARRKLQHSGQFLPVNPEVARRRKIKSYEIEQVAPKETASGLQQRIANNA